MLSCRGGGCHATSWIGTVSVCIVLTDISGRAGLQARSTLRPVPLRPKVRHYPLIARRTRPRAWKNLAAEQSGGRSHRGPKSTRSSDAHFRCLEGLACLTPLALARWWVSRSEWYQASRRLPARVFLPE